MAHAQGGGGGGGGGWGLQGQLHSMQLPGQLRYS